MISPGMQAAGPVRQAAGGGPPGRADDMHASGRTLAQAESRGDHAGHGAARPYPRTPPRHEAATSAARLPNRRPHRCDSDQICGSKGSVVSGDCFRRLFNLSLTECAYEFHCAVMALAFTFVWSKS